MSSIEHFSTPAFVPGQHVLIDFYGASGLTEVDVIKQGLRDAATVCGASVLNINLHSFGEGQGVTGVALLAESHISIHTWPEFQYVALDVFMCGDCEPCKAIPVLEQLFLPSEKQINVVGRGNRLPTLSRFDGQNDFLPSIPESPVRLQKSERE